MKRLAHFVRCAAILVAGTAALASAQVPNQKPLTPQLPSRVNLHPMSPNHLQKIVPRNKIAGPAQGQRGAGLPGRGKIKRASKMKMKNGSK